MTALRIVLLNFGILLSFNTLTAEQVTYPIPGTFIEQFDRDHRVSGSPIQSVMYNSAYGKLDPETLFIFISKIPNDTLFLRSVSCDAKYSSSGRYVIPKGKTGFLRLIYPTIYHRELIKYTQSQIAITVLVSETDDTIGFIPVSWNQIKNDSLVIYINSPLEELIYFKTQNNQNEILFKSIGGCGKTFTKECHMKRLNGSAPFNLIMFSEISDVISDPVVIKIY